MITISDSLNTVDLGRYFAILPSSGMTLREHYLAQPGVKAVPQGFAYNSGSNSDVLTIEQLRELIREHVDPDFRT